MKPKDLIGHVHNLLYYAALSGRYLQYLYHDILEGMHLLVFRLYYWLLIGPTKLITYLIDFFFSKITKWIIQCNRYVPIYYHILSV